jgi:ADP-ribosylglycohydrolase
MAADRTLDRVRGGLYGIAYGDAMGMPGELWTQTHVRRHFGRIDTFLPGPDGHFIVDGFVAGQTTDDTQQSVVLATELIEGDGVIDPARFGRRLVEWADRIGASEGNFLGPNSARALQLIRDGAPLEESGARGDTNGSSMRIVPVGLAVPVGDLDRLVATVVEACRPTHFTDVGISGACLIAGAASAAVDAIDFDAVIEPALRAAELGRKHGNETLRGSVRRRAELAISLVRGASDDDDVLDALYEVNGAGVETLESVPTALALAVAADGDPTRSARLAANLGGDTDTIGAMATGICGAFTGFAAFPAQEIAHLDSVNDLGLLELAAGLHRLRQRPAA